MIFYLARKSKVWYIISLIPILSLVLTRSLTGIISIIIVFSIALLLDFYKTKKFNFSLVVPILLILVTSLFGNNFGYKFPALDPSMCPPESADKCDCSIYDDEQDIAKNSSNVFESVFSRISIIASGGIGGFENIETLNQYIKNSNFKIFGDGLGFSNIQYSPEFAEITKQTKDGQTIYRNPGQVVSFNNLYANLYLSGGIISLLMFLYILRNTFKKLLNNYSTQDTYLLAGILSILLMFFFQAEELSSQLAIFLGLVTMKISDE